MFYKVWKQRTICAHKIETENLLKTGSVSTERCTNECKKQQSRAEQSTTHSKCSEPSRRCTLHLDGMCTICILLFLHYFIFYMLVHVCVCASTRCCWLVDVSKAFVKSLLCHRYSIYISLNLSVHGTNEFGGIEACKKESEREKMRNVCSAHTIRIYVLCVCAQCSVYTANHFLRHLI